MGGRQMHSVEARRRAYLPTIQAFLSRDFTLFILALLLFRLLLLVMLGSFVEEREFTDDVDMLQEIARHPFKLLIGHSRYAQHPPLLGFAEAAFFAPVDVFANEFENYRITLILYELLGAALLWFALSLYPEPVTRTTRLLLASAYLLLPSQWMSSVVMAQDEIIAFVFILAVLACIAARRYSAALLVAGFGVAAGKIFIILLLFPLLALSPSPKLWKRLLIGATPVALAYLVQFVGAFTWVDHVPLASFHPAAPFSISFWTWLTPLLGLSVPHTLRISGTLGLTASVVLTLVAIYLWEDVNLKNASSSQRLTENIATLFYAVLAWFFAFFYHVNPEYLALLSACVLLMRPGLAFLLAHATLCTLAWLVNFAYGIDKSLSSTKALHGKAKFVRLYQEYSPLDPHTVYELALAVSVALLIGLAVWSTVLTLARIRVHERYAVAAPEWTGARSTAD
jgi:hypothetical protein